MSNAVSEIKKIDFLMSEFFIVSAGKHLSNTNLSDLSIVGTCDIFVY